MTDMDLIPIGAAARQLGVNASALRYYEDRGLVRPAARRGGRRLYGRAELRRLALIRIMQGLGLSLDAASAVLDEPSDKWRKVLREQLAALEEWIVRARGAQDFLQHAVNCPADHPVRECPYLIETLDRLLAGVSFEQLAGEHGYPAPTPSE